MNILTSKIQAAGALSPKNSDIYHVDWQLINSCPNNCAYCPSPSRASNHILLKDKLLAMADRILEFARPCYCVNFIGGEPVSHPLLPEIVAHLLSSKRNVKVSVNLLASLPIMNYIPIIKDVSSVPIIFNLNVHPQFSNMGALFKIATFIAENRHKVNFRLLYQAAQSEANINFLKSLTALRDILPFNFEIYPTLPEEREKLKKDEPLSQYICKLSESAPSRNLDKPCAPTQEILYDGKVLPIHENDVFSYGIFKNFYWCLGDNYLNIQANGEYDFGFPNFSRSRIKLADTNENYLADASFIAGNINGNPSPNAFKYVPRFRKHEDASLFQKEFNLRKEAISWQEGSLYSRDGNIDQIDLLMNRIKRLEPRNYVAKMPASSTELDSEKAKIANQAIMNARLEDLAKIYERLCTPESQQTFLCAIKSWTEADSRYLPNSFPDTPPENNTIAKNAVRIVLADDDSSALLDEKLNKNADIIENLPLLEIQYFFNPIASPEKFLDCLLETMERFPNHKISLSLEKPQTPVLVARALCGHDEIVPSPTKKATFILVSGGQLDSLKKSMESILIQSIEDFELFIVIAAERGEDFNLIDGFIQNSPGKIKVFPGSPKDFVGKLNICLQMAAGEYIAFVNSGDVVASTFLREGIQLLEEHNADIVNFNVCQDFEGVHEDAVYKLLAQGIRSLTPGGSILRKKALALAGMNFNVSHKHSLFLFNLNAYVLLDKAIFSCAGQYQPQKNQELDFFNAYAQFPALVSELAGFFQRNGLSMDNAANFLVRLFKKHRIQIAEAISIADTQNRLGELFSEKTLKAVAEIKPLLCQIIRDYASLYCKKNKRAPAIFSGNFNWREEAAMLRPPKTFKSYNNADKPVNDAPRLSVIMPNYNKLNWVGASVNSILNQTLANFELILVDDHSLDGSYELLQNFADNDARIRLYRMDYNVRQGICRNIGIEKARGKYIIFVDSDDVCVQDYFEKAVKAIEEDQTDLVMFSSQYKLEDGQKGWTNHLRNKILSRKDTIDDYFKGVFQPAPWAKIYRRDLILQGGCRFVEYVFHQDVPFVFSYLNVMQAASTRQEIVYQRVLSPDSAIRPSAIKYIHLHSAYKYYEYTQKSTALVFGEHFVDAMPKDALLHTKWNVENIFLEKCFAFIRSIDEIPMTEADHRLLRSATLFLYVLFSGWAKTVVEMRDEVLDWRETREGSQNKQNIFPKPILSVILRVKNDSAELLDVINSAINQSLPDFEILADISEADENAIFLLEELAHGNQKLIITRDKSILKLAQGEYVCFLANDPLNDNVFLEGVYNLRMFPEADFIQFARNGDNGLTSSALMDKNVLQERLANNIGQQDLLTSGIFKKSFLLELGIQLPALYMPYTTAQIYSSANLAIFLPNLSFTTCGQQPAVHFALGSILADIPKTSALLSDFLDSAQLTQYFYNYIAAYLQPAMKAFLALKPQSLPEQAIYGLQGQTAFLEGMLMRLCGERPVSSQDSFSFKKKSGEFFLSSIGNPKWENPDPLLSVILPTRNQASDLRRSIESLLAQKHKNIEIIVVDNASDKDDTLSVCFELEKTFTNLVCWQASQFMKNAVLRNLAMDVARGRFLCFMECGAILSPGFMRKTIGILESRAEFDQLFFDAGNGVSNLGEEQKLSPEQFFELLAEKPLSRPLASGFIYRKKFLSEHGVKFQNGDERDGCFELSLLNKSPASLISPGVGFIYESMSNDPSAPCGDLDLLDIGECVRDFQGLYEQLSSKANMPSEKRAFLQDFMYLQLRKILYAMQAGQPLSNKTGAALAACPDLILNTFFLYAKNMGIL